MRALNSKILSLTILLLSSGELASQTQLSLSNDDIALLDLVFAPLQVAASQSGVSLPARVTTSPEQVTQGISRYGGVLERWHAVPGQSVARGATLLSIHSPEILALQLQYLEQDNAIQLLRQQVQRDRQLQESGVISLQRLQLSESQLQRSEVNLRASQQSLRDAGLSAGDIEALKNGNLDLGMGFVRAPADGVIAHRHYVTGEHIDANEVVATLAGSDRPWLSVQVPARLMTMLNEQSYFTVVGTGERLSLRQRDYVIDPDTQSIEVLAEFDNDSNLAVGQVIRVMLHPGIQAVHIPAQAVVHEGNQTLVYVRNNQGVEVRALDLIPVGDGYQATSGVSAGEQVLVRGAALVKGMQLGLGSDE